MAELQSRLGPHSELDLDVGEQIRRLQVLLELRAAAVLTDQELIDLKRRVLSPGWEAGSTPPVSTNGRPKAARNGGPGPTLDCREPKGRYLATLEVVGTLPIAYRLGANSRPLYATWKKALARAATQAAASAGPILGERFSLRVRRRLVSSETNVGVLAEVWALEA